MQNSQRKNAYQRFHRLKVVNDQQKEELQKLGEVQKIADREKNLKRRAQVWACKIDVKKKKLEEELFSAKTAIRALEPLKNRMMESLI